MTLEKLIEEYKAQPKICSRIDYLDKKTIRANNNAISKMYKIVDAINKNFGQKGTIEFQKLLDLKEDRINIWAAVHLLEKLNSSKAIETKALKIIREVAKGDDITAFGFRHWLKDWKNKRKPS
jgi:hypothetical protein